MKIGNALTFCCLAITLLLISGCGQKTATVEGVITFAKKPLTTGEIHFVGEGDQPPRSSLINPDGSYKVENCPLGEVKVAVVSNQYDAPPPENAGLLATGKEVRLDPPRKKGTNVPSKYNDPQTSALVYPIKPGKTTININLH